jgi:predicted ATPase
MQVLGDNEGLAADTGGLFTLASEQGFALFRAVATAHRGALLARTARPDEGIALLDQGIAAYRETDAVRELPFLLASLAEAQRGAGHREESLRSLDEALRLAREMDGCWCEAELHRLKGMVLASDCGGREAEAEGCFAEAIAVARQQGARFWELRAAAGLARLRRDQGRHREAHALLAPVHGWFTEDVASPDLVEARTLLDELGAAPADGGDRSRGKVRMPPGPDRLREPMPGR